MTWNEHSFNQGFLGGEFSKHRREKAEARRKRRLGLSVEKRMVKRGMSRANAVAKAHRAMVRGGSDAESSDALEP